jgi:hypothetical protein
MMDGWLSGEEWVARKRDWLLLAKLESRLLP